MLSPSPERGCESQLMALENVVCYFVLIPLYRPDICARFLGGEGIFFPLNSPDCWAGVCSQLFAGAPRAVA